MASAEICVKRSRRTNTDTLPELRLVEPGLLCRFDAGATIGAGDGFVDAGLQTGIVRQHVGDTRAVSPGPPPAVQGRMVRAEGRNALGVV